MRKINKIIYNKLLLQAEEAHEFGMTKLASGILTALEDGASDKNTSEKYSYSELKDDLYKEMWKLVSKVISHHNTESLDAEKVSDLIDNMSEQFIEELESIITLDKESPSLIED